MTMTKNIEPFFLEYEKLVEQADQAFSSVQEKYRDEVKCAVKCADCCHALFDLSLIEAMYIKEHFERELDAETKALFVDKANQADRKIYQIKRNANRYLEAGKDEGEIMAEISLERVRCPMLNDEDQCQIYDHRPITCRLYGIPTGIGGRGHTCGMSGFVEGKQYPSANLDIINNKLYEISTKYAKSIESGYSKLGELIVPLSMAILTDYNDEYLGIGKKKEQDDKKDANQA